MSPTDGLRGSDNLAARYAAGSEAPPEQGPCRWCRGTEEHEDNCRYLAYLRGERPHPADGYR